MVEGQLRRENKGHRGWLGEATHPAEHRELVWYPRQMTETLQQGDVKRPGTEHRTKPWFWCC